MKRKQILGYVPLLVVGFACVNVIGCSPSNTSNAGNEPVASVAPIATKQNTATPVSKQDTTIFVVETNADGSHLEARHIALATQPGDKESMVRGAVEAMNAMGKMKSPLPVGTTVKSVVFAEDGTATLDLSREFKANFTGGNENEALALNAITGLMGQFDGVRQVQILVNGEKIESLGGHQTINQPLPVPKSIAKNTLGKGN